MTVTRKLDAFQRTETGGYQRVLNIKKGDGMAGFNAAEALLRLMTLPCAFK